METSIDSATLTVTTDTADYPPGATAVITATGMEAGAALTFCVMHVESAGVDGIWGTADDVIRQTDGEGHEPWVVVDGGAGDLDGMVNGSITTAWYVNPDDSASERFLLSVASSQSSAYATFTDTPSQHDPVDAVPDLANYAMFFATGDGPTGSGVIDSFLRIQGTGNEEVEQGYNTDYRPQQFDEGSTAVFNHAIRLDSIPVVEINGVFYREFRLDLNDSDNQNSPLIALNNIKIFSSDVPDLTGLNLGTNTFSSGSSTLLYDLDGGGDITVQLTDWNTGSGHGDYFVYIPVNGANGNPGFAGITDNPYIYLYSAFGVGDRTNGGFEEWYIRKEEAPPVAKFSLVKVVSDIDGSDDDIVHHANDVIQYTITLTNTGNIALTGVQVTDNFADANSLQFDSGDIDDDGELDVGEVWFYTATHTVTQAEMDAGGYLTNVAEAQADQVSPAAAFVITAINQNPLLEINKSVDVILGSEDEKVHAAGNIIYYSIEVKNAGNVSLTDVTVIDEFADEESLVLSYGDNDNIGVLDVNETWVYTAKHTVTQAEMNAGVNLINTATADSEQTDVVSDSVSTEIEPHPDLEIDKVVVRIEGSADDKVHAADNIIHYLITVTNTGNVSLTDMEVNDTYADRGSLLYQSGDDNHNNQFDAGEAWIYTATHTVTQEEMDAGDDLINRATADSGQTPSKFSEVSTVVVQDPKFEIQKVVSEIVGGKLELADLGEEWIVQGAGNQIHYIVTLTNTGNVTLTNIDVGDLFQNSDILELVQTEFGNGDDRLDVDESWIFTATHIVTQAEMDAGASLLNMAIADTNETDEESSSVLTRIDQNPDLTITKVVSRIEGSTDSEKVYAAGNVINYEIAVENSGNVTLTQVEVTDQFADPLSLVRDRVIGGNDDNRLDVGEIWVYLATHTVTQEEMDAGIDLKNTAIADSEQTDEHSSSVSTTIQQNPHLVLQKITGDGVGGTIVDGDGVTILAGNAVTWTYSLKNDGNVSIAFDKSQGLKDDNGTTGTTADDFNPVYQSGDMNNDNILSVDEIWVFSATGTAIFGSYNNRAVATTTFNSLQVTAVDTSSYIGTFTEAWAGRTQGYWSARTEAWDGLTSNKVKGSGIDLRAAEINPKASGDVLIGDLNQNGVTDVNENTLLVSKAIAQNILSSSVVSDNRISMLQQAIAAQLNIYNGDVNPGKAWSTTNSTDKSAGDLITEAVAWLKNYGGQLFGDGLLNSTDYNLTKSTLTSATGYNKTTFWSTSMDVDGTAADVHATGEDLKNVLMAFNTNKLITSSQNQVAWNQTTVDPEHLVSPVNVVTNDADAFWLVAQNNIGNFGLVWHG